MAKPVPNGNGWIKNPDPSLWEVSFYSVLYVCFMVLLLPLIVVALLVVLINDRVWIGGGFFRGFYYSCLYGHY